MFHAGSDMLPGELNGPLRILSSKRVQDLAMLCQNLCNSFISQIFRFVFHIDSFNDFLQQINHHLVPGMFRQREVKSGIPKHEQPAVIRCRPVFLSL